MKQKICLITGASRGLGIELASKYKSAGYYLIGLSTHKPMREILALFDDYISCDLSSENSIDSLICYIEKKYQSIDILIHNAAVQNHYSILETTQYKNLLFNEFAVNFFAPVKITSGLLPILMQKPSKIIVISSLLQLGPKKSAPGYCSSKAALSNWVANLRSQLKPADIKVVEVIPGLIKTEMTKKASEKGLEPSLLAEFIFRNMDKDQIILPGARLAWLLAGFAPRLVKKIFLK
ncbi:MAG: SDR family oxidoreductase [Emcibacteraceae bacterium]